MKTLVVMLSFIAVSHCMIIKYKACEMSASVGDVAISPCDQLPCSFERGKSAGIEIKFKAVTDAQTLTSKVKGKIGPLWIPFPLSKPDGCTSEGLSCPIKAGQEYVFKYELPISSAYPKISVPVSWELVDENGKDVVCIIFPVKLT